MPVALSHETALQLLRAWDYVPHAPGGELSPGFEAASVRGSGPADARRLAADDHVCVERPTPAQVGALLEVANPFAAADAPVPRRSSATLFETPVDVLAPCRGQRSQSSRARPHVWGRALARRDVLPVQDGLVCCGPELVFAQVAATWEFERLVQLGYELTGSYALDPTSRFGVSERLPATTPERMRACLAGLGGMRGVERASAALDCVLPGAASPMEAKLAMYFSLPAARGGRHVKRPVLNMRYDLDGVAKQVTDRSFLRGDLCWPEEGVAVEYDSDAAHTGSDRIARDAQRRNALAALGVTVVVVTRAQAVDYGELNRAVTVVEHLLGRHPREFRADQDARRRRLHALLFGANASNAVCAAE